MREIKISSEESEQRLDKFLLKYLNRSTKSFIYKMLRKKNIKLNDKKAEGSEILIQGDNIKLFLSEETLALFMEKRRLTKVSQGINIIFEDENILICDKPAGVLSHSEKSTDTDTLVDRILFYLHETGQFNTSADSTFVPSIANRLDRNTTGLVVCGKKLHALQALNKMFAEGKVEKYYSTIVVGHILKGGIIRSHFVKDGDTNTSYVLETETENSKEIVTEYTPIKAENGFTLLQVKLITGKSHQIRVHLKSINHPIVGDRKYGDVKINSWAKAKFRINNQLLHAEKIIFKQQSGVLGYLYNRDFISPLPNYYNKIYSVNKTT